jgi:hypothetical protein
MLLSASSAQKSPLTCWKQATEGAGEVNILGQQAKGTVIDITNTSTGTSTKAVIDDEATKGENDKTLDSKALGKGPGAVPIWNSLKPGGPEFSGTLTPSATTPGASTPGFFSFDEPFGEIAKASIDPAALRAKINHVHDGGLEGGFHHGDDDEHE